MSCRTMHSCTSVAKNHLSHIARTNVEGCLFEASFYVILSFWLLPLEIFKTDHPPTSHPLPASSLSSLRILYCTHAPPLSSSHFILPGSSILHNICLIYPLSHSARVQTSSAWTFSKCLNQILTCPIRQPPLKYLNPSRLSSTCSLLSLKICVLCKQNSPGRLLLDFNHQLIHNYFKPEGTQSWSLM